MTPPTPSHPPGHLHRLAGGAAVQLSGKLTGRGLGFLAHMVVARALGTATYGVFGIGWTLFQLVGLLASMGLEHGAVRFASRHVGTAPDRIAAVLRRTLGLTAASGLLWGALLALASPFLADAVFDMPELRPVLLGFSCGVVLLAGLRVAAAGTRVSQRMRFSTLAEDLVLPSTHLLLLLALLALGWRLTAAVAAPLAAYAVAFTLVLVSLCTLFPILRRSPAGGASPPAGGTGDGSPADDVPSGGRLLAFSVAAALSGILGLLTIWADRLLVGALLSSTDAGIYMAASQISLLFGVVLSALNAVCAPMIAELYSKGETGELETLFRVSTRWGLYLTTPFFLLILAFPADLLRLLGEDYTGGGRALTILAAGQMVNLATGAVGVILVMSGRQNRLLTLSTLALMLNVALNVVWIPRWGMHGAALATAVSLSLLFIAALVAVRQAPGVWPYDRRLAKGALAALVAAAGLVPVRLAAPSMADWPLAPVWHLALAGAVAYGLFAGVLILRGLDREDRELLGRLIGNTPQENRAS